MVATACKQQPAVPDAGSSADGAIPDALVDAGADAADLDDAATPDAHPNVVTHPLGMNDVSILLQLPVDPLHGATFVRATGFPGEEVLIPRDVFASLVSAPGDVVQTFEEFHAVALRFDVCDRVAPGPCPTGADGSLRIVLQPVFSVGPGPKDIWAADVALHAFYPIPAAELPAFIKELRVLAQLHGFQPSSPIAINQALSSTAPPSEYGQKLRTLVSRYATATTLVRLALFARDAREPRFDWALRAVERSASGFTPLVIPGIGVTEQRIVLNEGHWPPSYTTTPIVDAPSGFLLATQRLLFDEATATAQAGALEALAQINNPTTTGFGTQQCVNCHVATPLLARRSESVGIDPDAVLGSFMSARPISIMFGLSPENDVSLRGFGWFNNGAMISRRVANETALVLDEIEQRYPPNEPTILPDAGVPDAPPMVKRVFVTRATRSADLKTAGGGMDGLDGGDRLCAYAAMTGNLGGEWTAWLSSSTVDAIDRIPDVGPWYLVDRTTLVFPSKAAITSLPMAAIDRDELGAQPPGPYNVWTGTDTNGRAAGTCNDWTTTAFNANGMLGLRVETDAKWTAYGHATCQAGPSHLYCFER